MKQFFQRILEDIRQKKNLELYLILIVLIALFLADIFGVEDTSAFSEIILAALAVLIYGQIGVRHEEEAKTKSIKELKNQIDINTKQVITEMRMRPRVSDVFEKDIPDLTLHIEEATVIKMQGVNLGRMVVHYLSALEKHLKRGREVKILISLPTPEIMTQMLFRDPDVSPDFIKGITSNVVENVKRLAAGLEHSEKLEFQGMPYIAPYLLIIIEKKDKPSMAFVRIRNFQIRYREQQTLVISSDTDFGAYSFFAEQFDKMWQATINYKKDHGEPVWE